MISAVTWPISDVAGAAKMKTSALRQLYETGVLKLRGDDKRSIGSGHKAGLSRLRAYEAAIVQNLKLHGVSVSRGAKSAFEFTINGNAGRVPGQLFPLGRTILTVSPSGAAVSNLALDSRVSDLFNDGVAVIVDCNKVVAEVDAALNSYN